MNCNECICNNGQVSCTETSCSDNVDEDDTSNTNDVDKSTVDGNNTADNATNTSSSIDDDWKTLKFDLKYGIVTYGFETEIPSEADMKLVSRENLDDYALITMEDAVIRVSVCTEDFYYPLKSVVEVFDHSQFGQVYRVMLKGDAKQWYSSNAKSSGTCSTIVRPNTPAPCGTSNLHDSSTASGGHYFVTCETDTDAGIAKCDQIVKTLAVTQK